MLKRIRSRWHCHPMLRRGAVGVIGAAFLLVVARLALDVETLTWRGAIRLDHRHGCCGVEAQWRRVEAQKASMPKAREFDGLTARQLRGRLPIWVISLASATDRRANVIRNMQAEGVDVELVDALDGRNASTPDDDVQE
ncbi:hypothetical protein MNEG_14936 [Monoraphidium neglectum]|uniref:Uncharacterized protein n=1 Tax=Monoraphidium neglectum TaxID=145388 RepID=A0A0D2IYR4_9CHLO|nr:hypothetical protein MNEG_14936 [Monoraphidium neglectum]KIY93027.1 hypothetical protein MNEG_14936 [Monoraphidium neglectum]|eukprot:XP_013892047.1 hypothetical protein MNEG_14936 [Monoraphidium neglectum]